MSEYENERLAKTEERLKSDSRRLDRLDRLERLADEVHIQNENIARLVVQLEFVGKQLSSHEKRLAKIEGLPGRGIRMLVGAVVTALASAVIGGLVALLF